jgi:Endonuclease/Exonuclease/phosphatase family
MSSHAIKTHPRYRKGLQTLPIMHLRTRTNGSRRRTQQPSQYMERWHSKGIKIGSVNIRGLTFLKLFLLLEQEEVDVLCVQETWIAEGTRAPTMPGYQVVEQRRQTGTHGGLATYYRTSLKLESTTGNEYGLLTKLILPTSKRVNIVNVYLPPTSSLTRRGIAESLATSQLEEVLSGMQPQLLTMVCGDFNARVGSLTPLLDHEHPPRIVTDTHVCPRASWFI